MKIFSNRSGIGHGLDFSKGDFEIARTVFAQRSQAKSQINGLKTEAHAAPYFQH
jgi:hypothetical protein